MIELNTRDLVTLVVITNWNIKQASDLANKPAHARPSLAMACTIKVLGNRNEPGGGLVNRFISDNRLNIEPADDSEQIYRSTRKLLAAGLLYPTENYRQQFAQTSLGEKLVRSLGTAPQTWPSSVKVEGNSITWPALSGR